VGCTGLSVVMRHRIGISGSVRTGTPVTCVDCLKFVLTTWMKGYFNSSLYRTHSDYDTGISADIIGHFTDIMFEKFGLIPHQRDADPLEECVIGQFPEKVSRIPEYFLIIAPGAHCILPVSRTREPPATCRRDGRGDGEGANPAPRSSGIPVPQ